MNFDVLVVGAGLAGATTANLLANKGKKVLVVEKRKNIAGNCYDFKNADNITIHKYGPHIFHTNNSKIWSFINQFGEFNQYQHRVLSYVQGQYVPFPVNTNTIEKLFGKSISVDQLKEFLENEVKVSSYNAPVRNFRDAVVSQVGERLYQLFFENYTRKQWAIDPQEISAEVATRIPIRLDRDERYFSDRFQGIPIKGYTSVISKMLSHSNISILLGADYFHVSNWIETNLTVYTGKLDEFFNKKHGELTYRSLNLSFKTIDKEIYQPTAVVNYPNDYDWTRITEFKHFLGEKSAKTTLLYEYPCEVGEPYYVVLTDENLQRRAKYLDEATNMERSGKYLFIGRLAEYKYYNMDQVIEAAINKVSGWEKSQ